MPTPKSDTEIQALRDANHTPRKKDERKLPRRKTKPPPEQRGPKGERR